MAQPTYRRHRHRRRHQRASPPPARSRSAGLKVATIEAQLFGGLVINMNELEPAPEGRAASGAELASELMEANAEPASTSIQEPVTALRDAGDVHGSRRPTPARYTRAARRRRVGRAPEEARRSRRSRIRRPRRLAMRRLRRPHVPERGSRRRRRRRFGAAGSARARATTAQACTSCIAATRSAPRRISSSRSKANDKISIVWNATVDAILGGKMVEKARVQARRRPHRRAAVRRRFRLHRPRAEHRLPAALRSSATQTASSTPTTTFETTRAGISAIGAVRSGYGGTLTDAIDEAQRVAQAVRARLT